MAFQGVDHIYCGDGLSLGMYSVGHGITDKLLQVKEGKGQGKGQEKEALSVIERFYETTSQDSPSQQSDV